MANQRFYRSPLERHAIMPFIIGEWNSRRLNDLPRYLRGIYHASVTLNPDHNILPELAMLYRVVLRVSPLCAAPDASTLSRETVRGTPQTLTQFRFTVAGGRRPNSSPEVAIPVHLGLLRWAGASRSTTEPAPSTGSGLVRGFCRLRRTAGTAWGRAQVPPLVVCSGAYSLL